MMTDVEVLMLASLLTGVILFFAGLRIGFIEGHKAGMKEINGGGE